MNKTDQHKNKVIYSMGEAEFKNSLKKVLQSVPPLKKKKKKSTKR